MKAILEFDLPEESDEFNLMIKANEMQMALSALRQRFRSHDKYDTPLPTVDDFYQILEEYNLGGIII